MAAPPSTKESAATHESSKVVDLEALIAQLEEENAFLQERVRATDELEKQAAALRARLEFVEEILGPTEAQRKTFHQDLVAARAAALHAKRFGAPVPTRVVGRIDESWLRSRGLSERDCALLQRGCVAGQDGVPCDISLLGDPLFCPYDEKTLEPRWEARGGALRLSLGDLKSRWGEDVALEVVRCAMELDRHDSSRRLGVELPWHEKEGRELKPAEVIAVLEKELSRRHGPPGRICAEDMQSDTASEDSRGGFASPTLTLMESVISAAGLDNNLASLPASPRRPDLEDVEAIDGFEWSLADADIEQLLGSAKVADTRSIIPSVGSESEDGDCDGSPSHEHLGPEM